MTTGLMYMFDKYADIKLQIRLENNDFAAIGRVTTHWAYLEDMISEALWMLLDRPEGVEFDKYLAIPFNKRARRLKDLVRKIVHDKDNCEKLIDLIDQASFVHSQRDIIVHGMASRYGQPKNQILFRHSKHTTEETWKDYQMAAEDITQIAKKISDIHYELQDFLWTKLKLGWPDQPPES